MDSLERLYEIYSNLGELQQSQDHENRTASTIIEEVAIDVGLVAKSRSNLSYTEIADTMDFVTRFFRARAEDTGESEE